jgi:hypothetical protein
MTPRARGDPAGSSWKCWVFHHKSSARLRFATVGTAKTRSLAADLVEYRATFLRSMPPAPAIAHIDHVGRPFVQIVGKAIASGGWVVTVNDITGASASHAHRHGRYDALADLPHRVLSSAGHGQSGDQWPCFTSTSNSADQLARPSRRR